MVQNVQEHAASHHLPFLYQSIKYMKLNYLTIHVEVKIVMQLVPKQKLFPQFDVHLGIKEIQKLLFLHHSLNHIPMDIQLLLE